MTMLTASCSINGGGPTVIDTACDWVRPIYVTANDVKVMDPQTKKDVLVHNETWRANCKSQFN